MTAVRQFVHVDGFGDDVAIVEWRGGDSSVWLILKDGRRRQTNQWTLGRCLKNVDLGVWRELSQDRPILKIVEKHRHEFHKTFLFGEPITSLSKEELMAAVTHLVKENQG